MSSSSGRTVSARGKEPLAGGTGLEILGKVDAVLEVLADAGERSAAEIAAAVDEPISSTYRLLANLRLMGWVDESPRRGRFRLGLQFLEIGSQVEDLWNPQEEALPRLKRLNQRTHLTAYLCVRQGDEAVCVGRFDGRSVRSLALDLGGSLPLDRGASPQAILASLPRPEQERVLIRLGHEHGSERFDALLRSLTGFARTGLAVSDEDVTPGIAALGTPVFNHRGESVVSISVSGLRHDVLDDPTVGEAVVATGREISTALGYRQAD